MDLFHVQKPGIGTYLNIQLYVAVADMRIIPYMANLLRSQNLFHIAM